MYSESSSSITGNTKVPRNDSLGIVLDIVWGTQTIVGKGIARLTVPDESAVTGATPALLNEDLIYKKVGAGQGVARTPFNPNPKPKQSFVARVNSDFDVNRWAKLAVLAHGEVLIDSKL